MMNNMTDAQFVVAVREALESEALQPGAEVKARILADRLRGERVILPVDGTIQMIPHLRRWALLAAALIGVIGVSTLRSSRSKQSVGDNDVFLSAGFIALA